MAALLQALIAVGLVGAAGFAFRATASQMNDAAEWIDLASYCSIAAIGAWLVWRKGGALIAAVSEHRSRRRALASAWPTRASHGGGPHSAFRWRPIAPSRPVARMGPRTHADTRTRRSD
jgi:nickel/cobalt transporter (NicO) family protein